MDSPTGMLPNVIRMEADPLEAGQMVGEFEVGRELAVGGMGIVYAAVHPVIGKRAAIKVLHPRFCDDEEVVDRFLTEARAVNQIGHPNIVDVFAFGALSDGRSYMVMEWLAGESLATRLERGPLPVSDAIRILDQIADALDAAHEKGIVHRDLKPDNIFLVPVRGGRTLVKLLDFGIAKLTTPPEGLPLNTTRPGSIMGTPGYLSPEQARGLGVDGRTDVYALGCVAFEMLAGRTPFDCDNMADMIVAHLESKPPPLRSVAPVVPKALDELVLRMLEKDPGLRPSLNDVRQISKGLMEPTTTTVRTEASEPAPRRWPKIAAAAGVVLGAGAIVLLVVSLQSTPPPVAAPKPVAEAPTPPPPPSPAEPTRGAMNLSVHPAAKIVVDGKVVAEATTRTALPVEPGTHEVQFLAAGYTPAVKYVRVNAGAESEVSVDLSAEVVAAPPPAPLPEPAKTKKPGLKTQKPKPSSKDYMLDPFHEE